MNPSGHTETICIPSTPEQDDGEFGENLSCI